MERLKKRAFVLAGIFGLSGVANLIASPTNVGGLDEKWMELHSLSSFGPYRMSTEDPQNPRVSYKMPQETYKELNPTGIVCRSFTDGSESYDVVLVASQAKDSFHDPRVCFTAQGWQLQDLTEEHVETDRGDLPLTVARIESPDSVRWAAFGYRDPQGFVASTNRLKFDLFTYSLTHARPASGVFYRFIGLSSGVDRPKLLNFIKQYMNASERFSEGYF